MAFTVYILKCADQSLYTGCTNNLEKRLVEHNSKKSGAKYTRARRPVQLVFKQVFRTLARGRAREAEIKRLTRLAKLLLIKKSKKILSTTR